MSAKKCGLVFTLLTLVKSKMLLTGTFCLTSLRRAVNMSQHRTVVDESGAISTYLEKTYDEAPCMSISPALYAVAPSCLHESIENLSIVCDLVYSF